MEYNNITKQKANKLEQSSSPIQGKKFLSKSLSVGGQQTRPLVLACLNANLHVFLYGYSSVSAACTSIIKLFITLQTRLNVLN